MALTRTIVPDSEDIWGKHRVRVEDITLDSSYTTGGYTLNAASLGWSQLDSVEVVAGNSASGGYDFNWDSTNKKLMAFVGAGFTPAGTVAAPVFTGTAHTHTLTLKNAAVADGATTRVNAGSNLLGANTGGDLTIAGNGANGGINNTTSAGTNSAPAFTGTAVSAAVASQVANATDLSAVVVRCRFIGI